MSEHTPDAWVEMPAAEELRPQLAGRKHPYDFGFLPAMARLMRTHGRIAKAYAPLYAEIMFSPEGRLSRRERELVAAVAAAGQDCRY